MADHVRDRDFAYKRRTDRNYYSTRFQQQGKSLRMFCKVFDGGRELGFATVDEETILKVQDRSRYQVKAAVVEDTREIRNLVIQRFSAKTGWCESPLFNFKPAEITALLNFIAGMKSIPLENINKSYLTDEVLSEVVLNKANAREVFRKHESLIIEFIQNEDLKADVVAVAHRREQLQQFEKMMQRVPAVSEAEWQKFFELNSWIFGYGLSYRFMTELDRKALQQFTTGFDLTTSGKQADAFMKTRGKVSATCFVEIKRTDTPLVTKAMDRPESWQPSAKLSAAVAQSQKTVYLAAQSLGRSFEARDADGTDTGEVLFNVEPKACLVAGNLSEFFKDGRLNRPKFESFELFRRNTLKPEIITFDELLERARFIVDSKVPNTGSRTERPRTRPVQQGDSDDDIPF